MSSPEYWKKAIDISQWKQFSDEMIQNLSRNNIWLGDRDIPYTRDKKTDPESWAPEKPNPFDDGIHKPRIYVSLGTNVNHKVDVLTSIMMVLHKKNLPANIAAGNDESLFQDLQNFRNDNSMTSIKVWKFAPQQELLSKSDIYFCHGGASSTAESIYLEVPMLM